MERKRISYARVLIEIDTSTNPIESFEVKLPSGTVYTQYIYYENLPKFCSHYYMFGHLKEKCRHLNGVKEKHVEPCSGIDNEVAEGILKETAVGPLKESSIPMGNNLACSDSILTPGNTGSNPREDSPLTNVMIDENGQDVNTKESVLPENNVCTDNTNSPANNDSSFPEIIPLEEPDKADNNGCTDNEGYQTVMRKKNKGKTGINQPTMCTLTSSLSSKPPYKDGLSKFLPIKNVPKFVLEKSKLKEKGAGGTPQTSISDQ